MKVTIITKYNFGDILDSNKGTGQVISIESYHDRHFVREGYMIKYCLEPLEYTGTEHDEQFWVSEVDIISKNN